MTLVPSNSEKKSVHINKIELETMCHHRGLSAGLKTKIDYELNTTEETIWGRHGDDRLSVCCRTFHFV